MKSLHDTKILITRAAEDTDRWAHRIEQLGGSPIALPCIRCEILDDPETAERLKQAVASCEWLMLTSVHGVQAAAQLLGAAPDERVAIAVVGEQTRREAQKLWGRVELQGDGSGARSLAKLLAARLNATPRIVVAAGDRARRDVDEILQAAGAKVTRVVTYRTVPIGVPEQTIDLQASGVDVILFASPSAVEGFTRQAEIPPDAKVISIGPTTSQAVRAAGLKVTAEAQSPDLDGLLEAIP